MLKITIALWSPLAASAPLVATASSSGAEMPLSLSRGPLLSLSRVICRAQSWESAIDVVRFSASKRIKLQPEALLATHVKMVRSQLPPSAIITPATVFGHLVRYQCMPYAHLPPAVWLYHLARQRASGAEPWSLFLIHASLMCRSAAGPQLLINTLVRMCTDARLDSSSSAEGASRMTTATDVVFKALFLDKLQYDRMPHRPTPFVGCEVLVEAAATWIKSKNDELCPVPLPGIDPVIVALTFAANFGARDDIAASAACVQRVVHSCVLGNGFTKASTCLDAAVALAVMWQRTRGLPCCSGLYSLSQLALYRAAQRYEGSPTALTLELQAAIAAAVIQQPGGQTTSMPIDIHVIRMVLQKWTHAPQGSDAATAFQVISKWVSQTQGELGVECSLMRRLVGLFQRELWVPFVTNYVVECVDAMSKHDIAPAELHMRQQLLFSTLEQALITVEDRLVCLSSCVAALQASNPGDDCFQHAVSAFLRPRIVSLITSDPQSIASLLNSVIAEPQSTPRAGILAVTMKMLTRVVFIVDDPTCPSSHVAAESCQRRASEIFISALCAELDAISRSTSSTGKFSCVEKAIDCIEVVMTESMSLGAAHAMRLVSRYAIVVSVHRNSLDEPKKRVLDLVRACLRVTAASHSPNDVGLIAQTLSPMLLHLLHTVGELPWVDAVRFLRIALEDEGNTKGNPFLALPLVARVTTMQPAAWETCLQLTAFPGTLTRKANEDLACDTEAAMIASLSVNFWRIKGLESVILSSHAPIRVKLSCLRSILDAGNGKRDATMLVSRTQQDVVKGCLLDLLRKSSFQPELVAVIRALVPMKMARGEDAKTRNLLIAILEDILDRFPEVSDVILDPLVAITNEARTHSEGVSSHLLDLLQRVISARARALEVKSVA